MAVFMVGYCACVVRRGPLGEGGRICISLSNDVSYCMKCIRYTRLNGCIDGRFKTDTCMHDSDSVRRTAFVKNTYMFVYMCACVVRRGPLGGGGGFYAYHAEMT